MIPTSREIDRADFKTIKNACWEDVLIGVQALVYLGIQDDTHAKARTPT